MFIVELTYIRPLADLDAAMTAHMRFVRKHYADGTFLVSGRKIPRDGGVIVAVAESRDAIEAVMRDDPFASQGLASVRIIEFRASQKADDINQRIERFQ
jgi:uncharacterized protein YciI